jgi:tRNA dimethylallyltransferase
MLALALAQHHHAEIVGVDAFQLYRGLPILTAQPAASLLSEKTSRENNERAVPHHLIGILAPTEESDAVRYSSMARPLIEEIAARKRLPLLVGGTGFYLQSLLSPLDPLPSADPDLRAQLTATSHEALLDQLQQLDPEASSQIDTKNRRRLERVIEILLLTRKSLKEVWKKKREETSPSIGLFLTRDRDDLYRRIEERVHFMFDQGVVEEVAAVTRLGPLSRTAAMTLGLREIEAYQRGEATLATTIKTITATTKQYAKRQITWFRNRHRFPVLNLSRFSSPEGALEAALELLQQQHCSYSHPQ